MLSLRGLTTRLTILVFALCAAAMAQSSHKPGHYITGPAEGTAEQIVLDYIYSDAFANNFNGNDLADLRLNAEVPSGKGRVTHLYFDQYISGIQVYRGILNATVKHDGRIISLGNRLLSNTADAPASRSVSLSATDALAAAANHLGLAAQNNYDMIQSPNGADQAQRFAGGNLSLDEIPVRLQYFEKDGELALTWFMIIRQQNSQDWWEMHVDVQTGEVIHKHNYTIYEKFPHNSFSNPFKSPRKSTALYDQYLSRNRLVDGSAYFVVPPGIESPMHGDMQLVSEPADATASPFGWHDTDGVAGAEFTITRGNNVHAYQARDADVSNPTTNATTNSQGDEPDGGDNLLFNLVPDFNGAPVGYVDAATVNLFFWNNLAHDLMVHYGFDEAAGNFQQTNYSGVGFGNDFVRARAQAGANVGLGNNANFSTPTDGASGIMNMFEFSGAAGFEVNEPVNLAGFYDALFASFGSAPPEGGLTGIIEVADDGQGATTGCDALVGFTAGRIALIDRGDCEFGQKALNAENAGAIGVIIVNNQGDSPMGMSAGTVGDQVTIPVLSLGQTDGTLLKTTAQGGTDVNVTFFPAVDRDSDYDSGIILHEYGHGISNRLAGGPNTGGCLSTGSFPEQGGEGWSDFYGLVFSPGEGDMRTRGVGTYAQSQSITGPGIREFRYSPDMEINPVTYDKLKDPGIAVPHGVGHALNTVLWDLYWALIDEVGFDADLYTGTGGNNIAIMLVTEGLKIMPCGPTFVDYRDAVLSADLALYDGQFNCLIWSVFARRGLGENADGGSAGSITDGTEDFTVPTNCFCSAAAITGNPQDASQCEGSELTLSVTASGSELTYQWYHNGQIMVGETSASMVIASTTTADSGNYTCVVSNGCSEVTSSVAEVSITEAVAFDNASFARWGDDIGCGDANDNGVLDILDLSALAPLTPAP